MTRYFAVTFGRQDILWGQGALFYSSVLLSSDFVFLLRIANIASSWLLVM